jgi:hypothetical protein
MAGKRQKLIAEVLETAAGQITEQFERRLAALEAHIADLEDRLNERGAFSGEGLCTVPGNPAHLWEDDRARESQH